MTRKLTRVFGMTLSFLLVMLMVTSLSVVVHADTTVSAWDCLPIGSEYLNPDNITASRKEVYLTVKSLHLFRVKPSTTYTLYFERVVDAIELEATVLGYAYDKTGETELNATVNSYVWNTAPYEYDSGFTVTTLSDTYYLSFTFTLEAQDFAPSEYDKYLAFIEGEYDAAIGENNDAIESYRYEGAQEDYAPMLSGETGIYYTNYDNPVTVTEIKASLRAIDDIDGDISNRIMVETDNYTSVTNKVPGDYTVVFSVQDAAGNEAMLTMTIIVEDDKAPLFNGSRTFTSSASSPLYEADIRATISASDNVDGDLTSSITVKSDSYTGNEKVQGRYDIVYAVSDAAGNEATFTVSVSVSDLEAPIISGPSLVTQSNTATNTVQYYKNLMSATDNGTDVTSAITIIQDNYTANIGKIGSWTITFRVSDAAGNVAEKVLEVKITDQVAPIFFVDSTLVLLEARENAVTTHAMISSLKSIGMIEDDAEVTVMRDTYTGNEEKAGTYEITLGCGAETFTLAVQVMNGYDLATQAKPRFALQTSALIKEVFKAFLSLFH